MLALTKKISFAVFLIFTFIYIGSFFLLPLTDWDPTFYCLIGKGIISKHILPYGYIFDHKPYLLYVLYYIWDAATPFPLGKFPLLALCSLVFIAYLSKNIFNINGKFAFVMMFLGGIPSGYLDGNSEVLQIPFIFSSLFLLLKGSETGKALPCIVSSFLAVIALNINYLAGFILLPILLYVIFSSQYKKKCFLVSTLTASGTLFIVILPFLWKGHGNIIEYFVMQRHFINRYGVDISGRIETLKDTIFAMSIVYPIFIYLFTYKTSFILSSKVRLLILWILASLLASISSGHNFTHYWALFIIPTMILAAVLFNRKDPKIFIMIVPLLCYDTLTMMNAIISNISLTKKVKRADIAYLHTTIGNARVLGMVSSPSLFYLSNLEPYDRFLFPGHIDLYFGAKAKEHYLEDLNGRPPFVMTRYNSCKTNETDPIICEYLTKNYTLIHQAYNHKSPLKKDRYYYDLYKLRSIPPKR